MTLPSLPTLGSPENTVFHPAFQFALDRALANKGLGGWSIKSQYSSPTGPIDLVVFDERSCKVVFPIEIKRTQSDVRGQGRRQARDYWINLGTQCQTGFYCVSNLEIIELFRNDYARRTTSSQRVELEHGNIGVLDGANSHDFYNALVRGIEEVLDIVLEAIPFRYANGLSQLQANLATAIEYERWHQTFMPACFEYIRGAATNNPHLKAYTNAWRSADFYQGNPVRLIQYGQRIDFSLVFQAPAPVPHDPEAFSDVVLNEAFESGKAHAGGDDIAELVNEVLAPRYPGIVETDAELAQLMATAAKARLATELQAHEIVMDPAAGSGRLLTALVHNAFPGLRPGQVWANEKEPRFAQSLSLRLGLAFAQTLSPDNAPRISIQPIESVAPECFEPVRMVLMNPPFISGVLGAEAKRHFASRIAEVSGAPSRLDEGQVALEILFLELISNLVQQDTVVATVFPTQHLYRLSGEVARFRQFLLEDFGLTDIVVYQSRGIFQGVTKQTLVLVGNKGSRPESVRLIEVHQQLGNVDFSSLAQVLATPDSDALRGVHISVLSRAELTGLVDSGWKQAIGAGKRASAFIDAYFDGFDNLGALPRNQVRRGTVGNGGNTSLTVFSRTGHRHRELEPLIPVSWRWPALNTTDAMPRLLTRSNAPQEAFMPPLQAYETDTAEHQQLLAIVDTYLTLERPAQGAQPRRVHTREEVVRKLRADQRDFGTGWVLIQRASRTRGQVGLLEDEGVLLSTNVPMVQLPTAVERQLLASWLLSIFGQLQLELYSTPQEGMRKLEMTGIRKVQYPRFSTMPEALVEQLCSNLADEPALEFSRIAARPSDALWASVLCPHDAQSCLQAALDLVQELVDERQGFGNAA